MPKFSILIPTYNDESTITETLQSINNQTFTDYEVLICNDGSTDNTEKIIKDFIKKNNLFDKYKYYSQSNADQLNAIITLINHLSGKYVYILHSDDLFYNNNSLKDMFDFFEENDCDAIMGDYEIINDKSEKTGVLSCEKYNDKKYIPPLLLLWLGRNLFMDLPVVKASVFKNQFFNNYLTWNMPFWLNDDMTMLNVKNTPFPIRKYRLNGNNYLDSPLAKYNVVNGEIRNVSRLLKHYYIPLYKVQYFIYRAFNKMGIKYIPLYKNHETKNKYNIIKFVLNKRLSDSEIESNLFLKSLLQFHKNYKDDLYEIPKIKSSLFIYKGKDIKRFTNDLQNEKLDEFYIAFLKRMQMGFNKIKVSKQDSEKIKDICKFLCIDNYVKIEKR